jgi:hypothetical protein
MARQATLKEQFERVEFLVRAVAEDKLPGMILCGPPGWAKTFTVRRALRTAGIEPVITTVNNEHAFVHTLMMNSRAPVIVADDTDQLASRPTCLNIAKGAFGPDHTVVWESRMAQKLGLQRFKISSRLIWISNRDYTNAASCREDLQAHWGALASRGIRPVWLDTTDQEDAFRYVVRLACTSSAMWHLKQPLGKAKSEAAMRWFCESRNHFLEMSPRCMMHVISAFHVARDDIKQRDSLLAELVGLEPPRKLAEIVVPTLDGHRWINVPGGAPDDDDEPPPTNKKATTRADKNSAEIPAQEKRRENHESHGGKPSAKGRKRNPDFYDEDGRYLNPADRASRDLWTAMQQASRDDWLAEHPGQDFPGHLSSEVKQWKGAKAKIADQKMRQAWLDEHPGQDPLPEHLCALDHPFRGHEEWCAEACRWLDAYDSRTAEPEPPLQPDAVDDGEQAPDAKAVKESKSWDHTYSVGEQVFDLPSQQMATILKIERLNGTTGRTFKKKYQQINLAVCQNAPLQENGDADMFIIIVDVKAPPESEARGYTRLFGDFCLPEEAKFWRGHDCM